MAIKTIIFDFDGVLADTFDLNFRIFRQLGVDFTRDSYRAYHDQNVYENPKLDNINAIIKEYFLEICRRADAKYLFPLSGELKKLERIYTLLVISSNTEKAIWHMFDLGGWSDFFKKVYGVETDHSKVKKLRQIMAEWRFGPEECLFVTDTLGDLKEGKAAGVRTMAVTWGYHDEKRLAAGQPDAVVRRFFDLPLAISRLDAQGAEPAVMPGGHMGEEVKIC